MNLRLDADIRGGFGALWVFQMEHFAKVVKGYLQYKTILCHKVALDA